MITPEQYFDSLRKLKLRVYLFGEKIDNFIEHPIIRPSLNSVAKTYELAQDPVHKDLMTVVSSLTGKKINRFTHLHQNTDDLIKKVKMLRLMGQETGTCFQRCPGLDAFNAVDSITKEMDDELHTEYHKRFRKFLQYVQEEDLVVGGAMTDPKGYRSKRPSEQTDPDLYLHIVEKRNDGIVVRGAKMHQTGAVASHEILVMPTIALRKEEESYAVCFALPSNAPGITHICGRQSCDTRKLEEGNIDVGNCRYGSLEAMIVFEDVFVPRERLFMCGEVSYAGILVERFAGYHRQSYGGCKVGVGDVLIGAAAQIAEFNGVARTSHIRDKLIEMVHLNETLYSCGLACSCQGTPTASGTYLIDLLLANVCKQNITGFPYEIARLAEDIAGGFIVTMPSEKDLCHPEIGKYIEKYLKGIDGVSAEKRMRMFRLIENLVLGTGAVGYKTESMHGAGSSSGSESDDFQAS